MAKKKANRSATQRWTAEKAGDILDEIEALGVTDSAFARRHRLKYGRIASWRRRLDRLRRGRRMNEQKPLLLAGEEKAGFVELKALPEAKEETRIEVMLLNGRVVLVPMVAPTDKLTVLLDTIEGRSC